MSREEQQSRQYKKGRRRGERTEMMRNTGRHTARTLVSNSFQQNPALKKQIKPTELMKYKNTVMIIYFNITIFPLDCTLWLPSHLLEAILMYKVGKTFQSH